MDSEKDARSRNRRTREIPLVALLALALAGCGPQPSPTPAGGPDLDPSFAVLKERVKVVVIDPAGGAHPDPVKIKKNVDIVIWVAKEGELHIEFPDNPFPQPMVCSGWFCGLLLPASGEARAYEYTASVTLGGSAQTVDPRLEVVP